jgi:predicted ATPase
VLERLAPICFAVRRKQKPSSRWLSPAAKRERRHFKCRWLTTRDESDRVAYRRCCRTTNSLINHSRNNHYRNRLAACADDPKKPWHAVGELLHSNNQDCVSSAADNSELCRTFSEFFVSKISILESSINSQIARFSPQFCDPPYVGRVLDYLPPVTAAEVYKLLTTHPVRSSQIDFIPSSLLKSCSGIFPELNAFLANLSFSQAVFVVALGTLLQLLY